MTDQPSKTNKSVNKMTNNTYQNPKDGRFCVFPRTFFWIPANRRTATDFRRKWAKDRRRTRARDRRKWTRDCRLWIDFPDARVRRVVSLTFLWRRFLLLRRGRYLVGFELGWIAKWLWRTKFTNRWNNLELNPALAYFKGLFEIMLHQSFYYCQYINNCENAF